MQTVNSLALIPNKLLYRLPGCTQVLEISTASYSWPRFQEAHSNVVSFGVCGMSSAAAHATHPDNFPYNFLVLRFQGKFMQ